MSKYELLSPAGDLERLKLALLYGADAVYIGGKDFSLRANATNFSIADILSATSYAHSINKKVYVTVNIVFHEDDLSGLKDYLISLSECSVDAIIVSDAVVIEVINHYHIPLEIHLSTQESILNHEAASFMKDLNVSRIVLAREASSKDIKKIKEVTKLDLEVFIHGAMCVSFSGRCVLSNICTNRDSNRGGCAQICRFPFSNLDNPLFTMTPKDLNMLPYIKELMDIGVNSFKVEGRMRSNYYVATVISTYREYIDKLENNTLLPGEINYFKDILNRCANRESTPQFFDHLPGVNEQYFNGRDEKSNQDFLAIVIGYDEINKMVILEQRNYFKIGDEVEFFGPNIKPFTYTIKELYDDFNESIEIARHPQMIIKIGDLPYLPKDSMMRVKVFDKSNYL